MIASGDAIRQICHPALTAQNRHFIILIHCLKHIGQSLLNQWQAIFSGHGTTIINHKCVWAWFLWISPQTLSLNTHSQQLNTCVNFVITQFTIDLKSFFLGHAIMIIKIINKFFNSYITRFDFATCANFRSCRRITRRIHINCKSTQIGLFHIDHPFKEQGRRQSNRW